MTDASKNTGKTSATKSKEKPTTAVGASLKSQRFFLHAALGVVAVLVVIWGAYMIITKPHGEDVWASVVRLWGSTEKHKAFSKNTVTVKNPDELLVSARDISDEKPAEVSDATLQSLDKRIDRLEGLVSEAGQYEQDINELKAFMNETRSHIFALQTALKSIELKQSKHSGKSVEHFESSKDFKAWQQQIDLDIKTLALKLRDYDRVWRCFQQAQIDFYKGKNWYGSLSGIKRINLVSDASVAKVIDESMKNLSFYAEQKVCSPLELKKSFIDIAEQEKQGQQKKVDDGFYLWRVQKMLRDIVHIRKTGEVHKVNEESFVHNVMNALMKHDVDRALDILRKQDNLSERYKAWMTKAELWINAIQALQQAEDAILGALLGLGLKGNDHG